MTASRKLCLTAATAIILASLNITAFAQQATVEEYKPYLLTTTKSRVAFDVDSYAFSGGHEFYDFRPAFFYGLPSGRHGLGIVVPLVHNVFNGDYGGYENTTGFGDIRFNYVGVPYIKDKIRGLLLVAGSLDVSVPTGNEKLGRGVGAPVYTPAVTAQFAFDQSWYIIPTMRFQFSTANVNSQNGSDGTPDLEDPEDDGKLQNISISVPTTYALDEWNGWATLSADYTYSLKETTYFLFMRIEVGKMIGDKTSLGLNLTQFIAGQPRLNTMFKLRMAFFL